MLPEELVFPRHFLYWANYLQEKSMRIEWKKLCRKELTESRRFAQKAFACNASQRAWRLGPHFSTPSGPSLGWLSWAQFSSDVAVTISLNWKDVSTCLHWGRIKVLVYQSFMKRKRKTDCVIGLLRSKQTIFHYNWIHIFRFWSQVWHSKFSTQTNQQLVKVLRITVKLK